jgi:ribosomal protein S19
MIRSSYKLDYQHKKVYNLYKLINYHEKLIFQYPKLMLKFLKRYKKGTRTFQFLKEGSFLIYKKSSSIKLPVLNKNMQVHDGFVLQRLLVKKNMLNYKFGQYIFTKRMGSYIHKDNKIAKKKAKILKQLMAKSLVSKSRKKVVKKKNK